MLIAVLYIALFILGFVFIHKNIDYENESIGFDIKTSYVMFVSFIIIIFIVEALSNSIKYTVNKTNLFINPNNATISENNGFYILTSSSTGQMFIFNKNKINVFDANNEEDQIIEIVGQYQVYYPEFPMLYKLNHGFDPDYDSRYVVEQINVSIFKNPGENKSIDDIVRKTLFLPLKNKSIY